MVYKISADSFNKINERSGTLQNIDSGYSIEMSDNETFDNGILVYPHQKHTFHNTDVYLRCTQDKATAEVRVVPFEIDNGGTSGSAVIYSDTTVANYDVASPSEVDSMLDNFFPN